MRGGGGYGRSRRSPALLARFFFPCPTNQLRKLCSLTRTTRRYYKILPLVTTAPETSHTRAHSPPPDDEQKLLSEKKKRRRKKKPTPAPPPRHQPARPQPPFPQERRGAAMARRGAMVAAGAAILAAYLVASASAQVRSADWTR